MAKSGGTFGHKALEPWEDLHTSAGSYDGGQCVGRHESYYMQRNSCSYRWQAVKRAFDEDKDIYNSHPVSSRRLSGTAVRNPRSKTADKYQRGGALVDISDEWETKAGYKVKTVTAKAFRTGFAPYSNQAHHLLPDAELRNSILEITKPATQVRDMIFQGLLEEKYNLNHWSNLMILPCGDKDGCAIGLPTHPGGHNHRTYSARLKDAIIDTLVPYKKVVKQVSNNEDHDYPDPIDIKNDLMDISDDVHDTIVGSRPLIRKRCSQGNDIKLDSLHPQIAAALR